MSYQAMSDGGKTTCKYYKTCGNTENCKRCKSYDKKPDFEEDYDRHKRAFDLDPELFLEDWRKKA